MNNEKFTNIELLFLSRFERNNHIYDCAIGEHSCMIQDKNNIYIVQKYVGNLFVYIEIINGFVRPFLFYDFKQIYEKMSNGLIEDF